MPSGVFADGGRIWIGPDGRIHFLPPWNPESKYGRALHEVLISVSGVNAATTIQETGLRQQAIRAAVEGLSKVVGELGGLAEKSRAVA